MEIFVFWLRRFMRYFNRNILFVLFMAFFSVAASGAKQSLPTLRMQDVIYQNACTGTEKLKLKNKLDRRVEMAKEAFSKIDVILCADRSASSKNKIIKMASPSVRIAGESTGSEPEFDVEVVSDRLIEDILAAGSAWDVSLRTSSHKLVLQYFANEACVKSVTFEKKKSGWIIVQVGYACD